MFRKKKQKEPEVNHADTSLRHVKKLLKMERLDAIIVDDNPEDAEFLTNALRKRGVVCIGISDPEEAERKIGLCNPRKIVLDFVGNEEISERLMLAYPDKAVICSGFIQDALNELADRVKGIFSKDNVDELAAFIKSS